MNIQVKGGTKRQRRAVEHCADWCAFDLLGSRLYKSCVLDIDLLIPEGGYGFCIWEDCNLRPRHFSIEIDKRLDTEDCLITLCHEMIHVKQYAKSEMREMYNGGYRVEWKGRKIGEKTHYKNTPWEKEAYAKEIKLYEKYIRSCPVKFEWPENYNIRSEANKLKSCMYEINEKIVSINNLPPI